MVTDLLLLLAVVLGPAVLPLLVPKPRLSRMVARDRARAGVATVPSR